MRFETEYLSLLTQAATRFMRSYHNSKIAYGGHGPCDWSAGLRSGAVRIRSLFDTPGRRPALRFMERTSRFLQQGRVVCHLNFTAPTFVRHGFPATFFAFGYPRRYQQTCQFATSAALHPKRCHFFLDRSKV